jgi:hypothetical protein
MRLVWRGDAEFFCTLPLIEIVHDVEEIFCNRKSEAVFSFTSCGSQVAAYAKFISMVRC